MSPVHKVHQPRKHPFGSTPTARGLTGAYFMELMLTKWCVSISARPLYNEPIQVVFLCSFSMISAASWASKCRKATPSSPLSVKHEIAHQLRYPELSAYRKLASAAMSVHWA